MGKAGEPTLTETAEPWQFGKIRHLREGKDHCIVTYGVITKLAIATAEALEKKGIQTAVVAVPTLKPLDREGLGEILSSFDDISVVEESAPRALGLEVEALAFRTRFTGRLQTFSLRDEFLHCYGSHDDILTAHGLNVGTILNRVVTGK